MPTNHEGHVRGGHVQMNQTILSLRDLGVDVLVASSAEQLEERVDICHIVGIQDDQFALSEVLRAKRLGAKVVLSPIWWDFDKLMLQEGWLSTLERRQPRWSTLARINPTMARATFMYWYRMRIYRANRRRAVVCRMADLTLPNSPGEAEQINRLAGKKIPYVAVRNGIDENLFRMTNLTGERDIPILFVGIVDRTKNVHRLIQSVQQLETPLVVVGQSPDGPYQAYCNSLDKKGLVEWKGKLTHEELVSHYNRTRVVVLSSMRETPGLALLEGAACGANVVVTNIGSAIEYFDDLAEYCNPFSVDSIVEALQRAFSRPCPNHELSDYVRSTFTWSLAAHDTLAGYEWVMKSRSTMVNSIRIGAFQHDARHI